LAFDRSGRQDAPLPYKSFQLARDSGKETSAGHFNRSDKRIEEKAMHALIDEGMVETIRTTGKTNESLPDRIEILEEYGLPYDRPAENVIISGCQILSSLPQVLRSLAAILDRKAFSYTFLSQEYCCGNYLYRPIIKARDDEAMAECRALSKEFVERNVERAKALAARRLVIFCSPCYPVYKHAFPEEDIVFYPVAINEVMDKVRFREGIDYYAGCYKLHKRFAPVPMDLKSTDDVFSNIEGLEINRISAPKCCFTPDGLSHMVGNIRTEQMVHICTGCYGQASQNLPEESKTAVMMLPQFIEKVIGG